MARERHSPAAPSPRGESSVPADTRRLASRAAWCRCELRTAPMLCCAQWSHILCITVHVCAVHVCARERPRLTKYMLAYNYQPHWCPALDIRHRCDRSQRVSTLRTPESGAWGCPVRGGRRRRRTARDEERRGPGLRGLVRSDQIIGFHVACLSYRRVRFRSGGAVKSGHTMHPIRQQIVRQ